MVDYTKPVVGQYKRNVKKYGQAAEKIGAEMERVAKSIGEVTSSYQSSAKSFAENPTKNYHSAVTDFSKSLTDSLGLTSFGSDDKEKRRSQAAVRKMLATIDPEDAAGVHQFATFKEFMKARRVGGKIRTKDLRRMKGQFNKRRADYQNRMARHQERMRGMETTRMSVAARSV